MKRSYSKSQSLLRQRKNRRAFTMIEMLIVATLSSGFLVLTAFWMQQTFKFSTSVKQRQREHMSLTRLAWDLRDSVRQAQSMTLDGQDKLMLGFEAGAMTFAILTDDSNRPVRIEKTYLADNGGQPVKAREIFELKSNSEARWDDSEMPAWVSLVVTRGPEGVAAMKSGKAGKENADKEESAGIESAFPVQLKVRVAPNRWPGSWKQAEDKQ